MQADPVDQHRFVRGKGHILCCLDVVQHLLQSLRCQFRFLQETGIRPDSAVGGDTVSVAVGKHTLCQRRKCKDALTQFGGGVLQTVPLDRIVSQKNDPCKYQISFSSPNLSISHAVMRLLVS